MHLRLVCLFVFYSFASFSQKLQIRQDSANHITIEFDGVQRVKSGEAIVNSSLPATASYHIMNNIALLYVDSKGRQLSDTAFAGILFDSFPGYKQGVALWRYKPWNSWSKPIAANALSELPEDDIQFAYWQYSDGLYAAAVPLNGNGFRTTLGSHHSKWGSKAIRYATGETTDSLPAMAIGFSTNPYELFDRIYKTALEAMGKGENLRTLKKFPAPFDYIGWCTWNASENGKQLNEQLLLNAAKNFSEHHFPIGWMLVDDGWFQQKDKQLQSYEPDPGKFPNGFHPMVTQLKKKFGIHYVGVWHTLNGLWNGIDPNSPLGKHFEKDMFSWTQKQQPDTDSPLKTYSFIRPESDSLFAFFNTWHGYLKKQGFDFVKVDNQLVTEKMAPGNYPIFTLADSMHKALYRSIDHHFNGAVLNCMDMTPDAYFNFGSTAVGRSEEDYFPYQPDENYNLQRGNAAAHVLQAIYNSIYFGQMVFPDFDLFQSHNPNGFYHAIARAINCGPIYITDVVGKQNYSVLRPLVYSDGRIIKSETPLLPAEDCLFQVQEPQLFKASSTVKNKGLLGVWNAADADSVSGKVKAADVRNLSGSAFAVYEYFSKRLIPLSDHQEIPVRLGRMGYRLYYVVPIKNGFASMGLVNKYNAPATILDESVSVNTARVTLYEGGKFVAYSNNRPKKVELDGKPFSAFKWEKKKLTVEVPARSKPVLTVSW